MSTTMTRPAPGRTVPYILAACTAVSILSTDLITPSIPDLPDAFGTSITAAQLTVSINLAAYALAQLVHGPVADAIGRRRLLLGAFVAFALTSAASALAPDIGWLLSGRFMQGLFSSVPSVVIVLMIRELYGPSRALAVMAIYGAALGMAPAVGPLIGGYLHVWFGWQAGFWFVAALALLVAAALWHQVPESLSVSHRLHLRGTLRGYGALLSNRRFLQPAVGVSLIFAALYAYVTTAPVVFIDLIGLPTERYGLTNLAVVAAFVAGNAIASRLGRRVTAARLLRLGALVTLAASVLLVLPLAAGQLGVVTMLVPVGLYAGSLALVLAAGPLEVLGVVADAPQGPAAALLGSLQLGLSAAAGYLSAQFYDGTALPMALVMALCVGLGAALILVAPLSGAARGSGRAG
ncbi:Bcr/CflA family efflux MFS transporter [Rhodobacteraceae bacterium 2CG4]|uniref:Bcr/CflA family efflux transporter n=1 Tax=Halovulum marinum TaxID=2662447 RepID=A0A6L5YXC8_9RHOB|nr:Bcr/CflA family efflux MFS transporter [Halovulum marinum]MSU88324.1 Bcr/CflA family efflux MFS transporter [Halovulum marinum]